MFPSFTRLAFFQCFVIDNSEGWEQSSMVEPLPSAHKVALDSDPDIAAIIINNNNKSNSLLLHILDDSFNQ